MTIGWYGVPAMVVAIVSEVVTVPPLAGVTVFGLKVHEVFAGWPEHEKVTAELKPPKPLMLSMTDADPPAETVAVVGEAEKLKSAVAGGVVFAVIAANNPCCSFESPAVM